MTNYKEVEEGVYQSTETTLRRTVDDKRIREIIQEKTPRTTPQGKNSFTSQRSN